MGEGRGGLGRRLPAVLPYAPRSRGRSREAESSKGDTHIWVLRAQCWLRGGEVRGREERQRNRRTGLSPEGLRPTHHRPGTRLGGGGLRRTLGDRCNPSTHSTPMWLPGKLSAACLGRCQTQTMQSTPAEARTPSLPPRWLAQGLRAGLGSGQDREGSLTGPSRAPAGQRVAVPRREATPAQPPCPGQAGTDTHCR